jgi:hypothetical protein
LLCVHVSSINVRLPSIGEKEVKRKGAKVLSLCEFKYSCCHSCCGLNLATPHSKNANPVWQSSVTSQPTSLVKQMPSTIRNHSLMMIMEMCIEIVFRNLDWIGNFIWSRICERRRCERRLWCVKFGNQINPIDMI